MSTGTEFGKEDGRDNAGEMTPQEEASDNWRVLLAHNGLQSTLNPLGVVGAIRMMDKLHVKGLQRTLMGMNCVPEGFRPDGNAGGKTVQAVKNLFSAAKSPRG